MESLWRQIFWFFITLAINNEAIFGYNVPAGLSVPSLRFWKEESKNLVPCPPSINAIRTDIPPLARTPRTLPEYQQGIQLQDGVGPTVTSPVPTSRLLPPVSLPPPLINSPVLQTSSSPIPLSHSCPALATASGLPGMLQILPTPPLLPVTAPIPSQVPQTNGPPVVLDNLIQPFQQTQIAFDNIPPTPGLPHVCSSTLNMQQNLPPPYLEAALLPPSQARVIQMNSCPSVPLSPEFSSQTLSFQTQQSCPTVLPPGTATIIPVVTQYPNQNTFVPMLPDLPVYQPGYQVTVLPAVSSVQTASESIAPPASYSYAPIPPGTANSEQSPVNLQSKSPEQSAPMPMPMPFPPSAPIIMMKSKSSWKKWLPTLLVSLFSRRCQGGGCCSCSSSDSQDNVYVPYPIPVPTNNPIILSGDHIDEDDEDDCEEENED